MVKSSQGLEAVTMSVAEDGNKPFLAYQELIGTLTGRDISSGQ